jgi:hypothetical protein
VAAAAFIGTHTHTQTQTQRDIRYISHRKKHGILLPVLKHPPATAHTHTRTHAQVDGGGDGADGGGGAAAAEAAAAEAAEASAASGASAAEAAEAAEEAAAASAASLRAEFSRRSGLLFVGHMAHFPNQQVASRQLLGSF